MIGTEPKPVVEELFEHGAERVLRELRTTLSALITAIPAVEIVKAADLQRALGVSGTLAWQVFKLAQSTDLVADGSGVPGTAAMMRFVEAAESRGAPALAIQVARHAVRDFDIFVKHHAGTRSSFDSMIAALDNGSSGSVDLQYRRTAFKANSHIWGVQAKTHLACYVFHPSKSDESRLDFMGLRGLIGLKRLRRDASWVVSSARMADDDGRVRHVSEREPIDLPGSETHGVSLLREFCSRPLPKFRTLTTASGFLNVELESTAIGSRSAITCLIGDIYRNVFARFRDEHNQEHRTQTMVRTPCETMIHDVLVPAEVFGEQEPLLRIYGDHRNVDPALPGRECDLLALSESVTYLGKGISLLHTPHVPRYVEMVDHALRRVDWDPESFNVFRCRISYPVMPSSVVVQFAFPD